MPPTAVEQPPIGVALGIILRNRKVLVGWRDRKLPQGDCWEFPGGKIKAAETPQQAVVRELKEEVGLVVEIAALKPLIEFEWHYDKQNYFFSVHIVKNHRGQPKSHFYRQLKWQPVSELKPSDFPAANSVIIKALSLPHRYLITPALSDLVALSRGLSIAFQSNGLLAVFRAVELNSTAYINNARRLLSQNPIFNSRLLLHNHPQQVATLNAAGVQLSAEQARKYRTRPLAKEALLAISCHNRAELEQACRLEADFALLGPVKPTPSHPDNRSLGWDAFRALVKGIPIPVYAVGGLSEADLPNSRSYGAQGIAAIRGLRHLYSLYNKHNDY